MKLNRIKTIVIFMCCIVPVGMTACQNKEDKGQTTSIITSAPKSEHQSKANSAWKDNGTDVIVYGDTDISDMDFDSHSTEVLGVVPWYVKSGNAKKMLIKKEVHLKWVESDLESEVSHYSSNVSGCPLLTEIQVESGNQTLFSQDGILYKFGKQKRKGLYACPLMKSGEILIPEDTTLIWSCAFNSCAEITSVLVPKSVRGIGDAAFGNMQNCTEIKVSENNPYYESEDGVLYTKGKKVLVAYPSGKKDETFQVPDGVKYIASGAFMCANKLKKVVLPKSTTQICESAFRQCTKLKTIYAKGNIHYVDRFAFYKTTAKRENFPQFSERGADSWKNWRKETDKDFVSEDINWICGYRGLGI